MTLRRFGGYANVRRNRLKQSAELLAEALRIMDELTGRVPLRKRPHYAPTEHVSILQARILRRVWRGGRNAFVLGAGEGALVVSLILIV